MTLTQILSVQEKFLKFEDLQAFDYCERKYKEAGEPTERWRLINFLERMLQELQSSGTGYPKILLFRKKQIQRREYIIPNPSQTDDECACFGGWLLRGVPCPCPKGEPRREELRKLGMQI